jgi:uncharacterized protein YdcH (DUF465 family)
MERVTYLAKKHRELDRQIAELEQIRPDVRTEEQNALISSLKKKKLKLRDDMAAFGNGVT